MYIINTIIHNIIPVLTWLRLLKNLINLLLLFLYNAIIILNFIKEEYVGAMI